MYVMRTRQLQHFLPVICLFLGLNTLNAQCDVLPFVTFEYAIGPDGYTVTFKSEVCASMPLTYLWEFGDGATATEEHPIHRYAFEGTYIVKLTVTTDDNCMDKAYATKEVVIFAASPSALWSSLEGPARLAECQTATFEVKVVGGVPPYQYDWDMGAHYCTNCNQNCNGSSSNFVGDAVEQAQFGETGGNNTRAYVTVTDAVGNVEILYKEFKVGVGVDVEIIKNPNKAFFQIGETVVFFPDIDNFSELEYPIDYYWDFGDGITYLDNYDGGGVVHHAYSTSGNRSVTLTVKDALGTYTAVTNVVIVGPGGPPPPNCRVEVSGVPNEQTVTLDYDANSPLPSSANVQIGNSNCHGTPTTWHIYLPDCGLNNIFPNNNACLAPVYQNGVYVLDLIDPYACWDEYTCHLKPWGQVQFNGVNACCTAGGAPVFIKPSELDITSVMVEGSCRDFSLSAAVEGGGWKLVPENVNANPCTSISDFEERKKYKLYEWTVLDLSLSQELDLLDNVHAEHPNFDLSKPFFQQPDEAYDFYVRLKVTDSANQTASYTTSITLSPFVLMLEPEIDRCPDAWSKFTTFEDHIAVGGGFGRNFRFSWSTPSGDLNFKSEEDDDPFPTFMVPPSGSKVYNLTVQALDGPNGNPVPGCVLSDQITVHATPLTLTLPATAGACESQSVTQLGPNGNGLSGGSGRYKYYWSTANPANMTYLNHNNIANPVVSGVPAGTTITYKLQVTDVRSGCTTEAETVVTGYANDLSVELIAQDHVCYGKTIGLSAAYPFLPGARTSLEWSTDHPSHLVGRIRPVPNYVNVGPPHTKVPGTYHYTIRYINHDTGCYAEDTEAITIMDLWRHTGYKTVVKNGIEGQSAPLWNGNNNSITGLSSNTYVFWEGGEPSGLTYNSPPNQNIPKNGQFIPTPEHPYLYMRVIDQSTGCSQQYKTNEYIISTQAPTLSVNLDNYIICEDGEFCFEAVFDAHVESQLSSSLPHQVKIRYQLKEYFPLGPPMQTPILEMQIPLVSSTGVYKGGNCINLNDYNIQIPNSDDDQDFDFWVSIYDSAPFQNVTSNFNKVRLQHPISPLNDVSECVNYVGTSTLHGKAIHLGVNCSGGSKFIWGESSQIYAKDYIEIHPEGSVTFQTNSHVSPGSLQVGPRLYINPCGSPRPEPLKDTIQPPLALKIDQPEVSGLTTTPGTGELSIQAFPNPHDERLNLRFAIPADYQGEAYIRLTDMIGRDLGIVNAFSGISGGVYQVEYPTNHLPSGVYFYRIYLTDNRNAIVKTLKWSR